MSAAIEIKPALEDDAVRLAEIGAETFTATFGRLYSRENLNTFLAKSHTPDVYRKFIADPGFGVWLAEAPDGETLGYVVAGPCGLPVPDLAPNSGEVLRIYLKEGAKGSGVGARLLTTALEFLSARYAHVYLSVYAENKVAQRFYARFGFVKIHDYFYMVGDHADPEWIMELKT